MRFTLQTRATPDQVHLALTDFSARRAQIWHRSLDPEAYRLIEQGDTWAVARESTPRSPAWTIARYDWSEPGIVRWTVTESSYGGGGDGFARTVPGPRGGSTVRVEWEAAGAQRQKVMLFLIHHTPLALLIRRLWRQALDDLADA